MDSKCKTIPEDYTGKDGEVLHLSPDSPNPLNKKGMTEDLKQVANEVTANTIFCTKEVLTSDEAARYMGISKSYLYKLTMRGEILNRWERCVISTE